MPNPITRVLTVLELLQNHRRLSGAEIANRLGIDRRTVRRYIAALEDLGVPVTTEQGRHGGYMLIPGFKLPPMMFTNEEVMAVSLGLMAAKQLGSLELTPAIESVQTKLERVMPQSLISRAQAITNNTELKLPKPSWPLDGQLLLTLADSVQSEHCVRFIYCTPGKDALQRRVDPYGLLFQFNRWYLVGFCHLRHAMRSFRLDRIKDAHQLTVQFERPANFQVADYFIQSLNTMPQNHRVVLILHTDTETATEAFTCLPNTHALFQPHEDGLLLDTRVDCLAWFSKWLTQLDFPFTLLEPTELKSALRDKARALLKACETSQETFH